MTLAGNLNAQITAVDLLPEFLEELQARANDVNQGDRVTPLKCSMDALPFQDQEFDVIWSEGAIYNVGFETGVKAWSRFLKTGGKLVVSEITWLCADRPAELQSHWEKEYPEIDLASGRFAILEGLGFAPEAYFVLPPHCWLENYYLPMHRRFERFLAQNDHSEQARGIVEAEQYELDLYTRFYDFYGYGVYVARKL